MEPNDLGNSIRPHSRAPGRLAALGIIALVLILGFVVVVLWSTTGGKAHSASKATIEHTCQLVEAVLTDGPDASADPVGYALAQVRPLHQIKSTDAPLKKSIDQLSSAYETFYKDNGTPSAKADVTTAATSLHKYCPGVDA